jgi:hypothetical protein
MHICNGSLMRTPFDHLTIHIKRSFGHAFSTKMGHHPSPPGAPQLLTQAWFIN